MKTLGLDVGDKRIGVAVSDDEGQIAMPVTTVAGDEAPGEVIADILDIARNYEAEKIIVGMPTGLSGEPGPAAQKVAEFVRALQAHTDLAVAVWDERLTTALAEKTMLAADVSRRRRRHNIDKVAAALILQNYLDAHADDEVH